LALTLGKPLTIISDRVNVPANVSARITIDCTGKEAFSAVRNQWRAKDPYLNKVAVWTYYQGAQRDPGIAHLGFVSKQLNSAIKAVSIERSSEICYYDGSGLLRQGG